LLLLLDQTQIDEEVRNRIRDQIAADFQAVKDRDSVRERETAIGQKPATHAADDLEAIKARGRTEWLKLRRQAKTPSPTRKPTRVRDLPPRTGLEPDSGKSLDEDDSE
jgi:hypothetical protein